MTQQEGASLGAPPPTCAHCGSDRLRRARTHHGWQRLLRRSTPLRRYACGVCGHRGWTWRRLPMSAHPEEAERRGPTPASTRPQERRDRRARRRTLARRGVGLVLAAALGALIATRVVSCQSSPMREGIPGSGTSN